MPGTKIPMASYGYLHYTLNICYCKEEQAELNPWFSNISIKHYCKHYDWTIICFTFSEKWLKKIPDYYFYFTQRFLTKRYVIWNTHMNFRFSLFSKNKLESLWIILKRIGKPSHSFYVKALIYFFSYENIIHNYCFALNIQLLLYML